MTDPIALEGVSYDYNVEGWDGPAVRIELARPCPDCKATGVAFTHPLTGDMACAECDGAGMQLTPAGQALARFLRLIKGEARG